MKGSKIRAFHAHRLSLVHVVEDLRSVGSLLRRARERGVNPRRLAEVSGLSEKWIRKVLTPPEAVGQTEPYGSQTQPVIVHTQVKRRSAGSASYRRPTFAGYL